MQMIVEPDVAIMETQCKNANSAINPEEFWNVRIKTKAKDYLFVKVSLIYMITQVY